MPLFKSFKITNVFYGYRIVAALFVCSVIVSGCVFYTFGLFVSSLQADFGWGRGDIMVASTIMAFVMGGLSPFVGRLVNQYGASKVMAIGALIGGLGFIVLTQMHTIWQFYVGYALVGGGASAGGFVPATLVVSNWFRKRRGTAIGIMSAGIGAGGLSLPPLFGSYFIPNFGWQTSYLVFALLVWIIIPLALFLVKTRPSDMGLNPDGVADSELVADTEELTLQPAGLGLKAVLATSAFWLIVVSSITTQFSVAGVLSNQVPYLEDMGFSLATGAAVTAGTGLGSLCGKLFFGWLCDRIPSKYAWCISLGLQLAAINILTNMTSSSTMATLWSYAVLMGLGFGGLLPVTSMLTSTNFGLASYGIVFGVLQFAQSFGMAGGPLYAGYMFDAMGNYNLAFTVFITLYAIGIPTILAVRRPKLVLDFKEQ